MPYNPFPDTKISKECLSKYGSHQIKIVQYDNIGVVEFCERCGSGRWVSLRKKIPPTWGIKEVVNYGRNI